MFAFSSKLPTIYLSGGNFYLLTSSIVNIQVFKPGFSFIDSWPTPNLDGFSLVYSFHSEPREPKEKLAEIE